VPLLNYDALTDGEADQHFDLTVERHPTVVASFRTRATELGHDPSRLDGSPHSLICAWRLYRQWWDDGAESGPQVPPPPWVAPSGESDEYIGKLPIRVFGVVDELGHYLAEVVLQNVPGATWHIARKPKRFRYAFQNMPALDLAGDDLVPYWTAHVLALKLHDGGRREDEALLNTYMRQTRYVRAEDGSVT
jgi:hypothetical protein